MFQVGSQVQWTPIVGRCIGIVNIESSSSVLELLLLLLLFFLRVEQVCNSISSRFKSKNAPNFSERPLYTENVWLAFTFNAVKRIYLLRNNKKTWACVKTGTQC